MTSLELAKKAAAFLDNKKAERVHVIEIENISSLADYFVIATGNNNTHVRALADELEEKIRAQMFHLNGRAAPNASAAPAASPAEPAGFAAPERPMPQGVSITADDFNDED